MKIYRKELSESVLSSLITAVRSGKYNVIGKDKVRKEVVKEVRNNPSLIEKLDKKKYREPLIKKVKRTLHPSIGVFTQGNTLQDHFSTKHRDFSVYKKIFAITGKPKHIVDLGAGVNPLSYEKLECSPKYTAYEINEKQVEAANDFFKEKKINGKAMVKDVVQMKTFPKADMYFLFQALDSFEQVKNHKLSESLLKKIPSKWIVVSFSTITLSGKPMNVPHRRWFHLLLKRLRFNYVELPTETELFYVIERSN
jgi:hypothetical protein